MFDERSLSAMTFVLVLLAAAVSVWWTLRLASLLRRDGLGTRLPPSSHPEWTADDLPSRPF